MACHTKLSNDLEHDRNDLECNLNLDLNDLDLDLH